MLKLEDIKRGSQIDGLVPNAIATISVAEMVGEDANFGTVNENTSELI